MGNALRLLYHHYFSDHDQPLGHHGVSSSTVGVSALAHHLFHFEITSQVPEGLSKHVTSTKKHQSIWYSFILVALLGVFALAYFPGFMVLYEFGRVGELIFNCSCQSCRPTTLITRADYFDLEDDTQQYRQKRRKALHKYKKLSKEWRESKPPPKSPEEVSRLIIRIIKKPLQGNDLEGFLSFYGLPLPHSLVELTNGEAPLFADGLMFELHTLPVDAKAVPDGDGVTVYVDTSYTREQVPPEVIRVALERKEARAERNYIKADALQKQITDAGYRVLNINNEEILARKYRIRLRGIDAPENSMPYGKEAKDELVKIIDGKCLKILIFDEDQYGRFVGDIYCNGIFVQESMLKKGLAWHYTAHDKRPEFEKWEKEARAKRIGLWASSNPEMPWKWRRNNREQRY